MGFEIDYLPVGKNSNEKSGDAIAMRFWEEDPQDSVVMTIDGGTEKSGDALVNHIKEFYTTDHVHTAFLTHPDSDHVSGVRTVLNELEVGTLAAIIPWRHAKEILSILREYDSELTENAIIERLKNKYPAMKEAVDIADERGCAIVEPFARSDLVDFTTEVNTKMFLLGPSRKYYIEELLPFYECLYSKKTSLGKIVREVIKGAREITSWVIETWDNELLVEPAEDAVSPENNSSVIFAVQHQDQKFLFCGDAGVPALKKALCYGKEIFGLNTSDYNYFHVPHHGSRRNLGPNILNAMFGPPRTSMDSEKTYRGYISATRDDPKHPSRRITNALNRRGVRVYATQGGNLSFRSKDAPDRGWSNAKPIQFYDKVENVEEE